MKKSTRKVKKVTVRKKRSIKPQAGKIGKGAIIGIAVAVIAIGAGAYFFMNQGSTSSSPLAGIVKAPLNPNCEENDPELCKFLNNWQAQKNYVMNSTTTDKEGTKMESVFEISGENSHMLGKSDGKDNFEMINIDKTTYTKDYSDNKWWKHTYDPDKDLSKEVADTVKFEESETTETKTEYKAMGKEQCGNLNCFKYQIVDSGDTGYTEFIWFDDKDYLLRKQSSTDSEGNVTESTFAYNAAAISAPSPVKEGTPEAMYGIPEMSAEDKAAYEQMKQDMQQIQSDPAAADYGSPEDYEY